MDNLTELIERIETLINDHSYCVNGCTLSDDIEVALATYRVQRKTQQAWRTLPSRPRCSVEGCTSILTITDRGTVCRECRFDQQREGARS